MQSDTWKTFPIPTLSCQVLSLFSYH